MSFEKYPVIKPLLMARIGVVVLFILFIIIKNYLPQGEDGWSEPPIFDYIYLLFMGICISIITTTYTYYSWKLDTEEFRAWLESQKLAIPAKGRSAFFESYAIGCMRFTSPLMALIGFLLIGFTLFAIFKFFFG